MIRYLSTRRFSSTVRRLLRDAGDRLHGVVQPHSYEELFFERAGPVAHYIFTDFDRLTRYELDTASRFADALQAAAPDARILNRPARVLERYALLVALNRAGVNDFAAVRLECNERPRRYPVFIRAEDGYGGPETDLIENESAFVAALSDLDRRGLARRGRIAVEFAAERSADGLFRKYGAFKIGDRIVPHHLMRNRGWVVKREMSQSEGREVNDTTYRLTDAALDEEMAYIRGNPHAETLRRAFDIAGIDFGRADYGIVNGRVQIYEINTNPHMSNSSKIDARTPLRQLVREGMWSAFRALDTPIAARGRVAFHEARPRAHDLQLMGTWLPRSLVRRVIDRVRRPRARQ